MNESCTGGYLKKCCDCGKSIYMKEDFDSRWRPYESWIDGACDEGEWIRHQCNDGHRGGEGPIWTPDNSSPSSGGGVFARFLRGRPGAHG